MSKNNQMNKKLKLIAVTAMTAAVALTTLSASARGIAEGKITRVTSGSVNTNVFLDVAITAVPGEAGMT